MSTLYIEEYASLAGFGGASTPFKQSSGEVPQTPSLATQTVAIGVSSTQSAAFNASTYLIRLHTDVICSILIGANPTASATTPRMAANQTEYFGVLPGQKVAVITNT